MDVKSEDRIDNPYIDKFIKNWPDGHAARLQWVEEKMGVPRKWLVAMLELEGKFIENALSLSAGELADKAECVVASWCDVCSDALQWASWDAARFAEFDEAMKNKIMKKVCRDWIMERLFQKWSW